MKRVILVLPAGATLEALTVEQRLAIESVFGQFSLPMPGSIEHDGKVLCDAVTGDNFDPAVMPALGLDWPILALWQWNEEVEVITPLDLDELVKYLPDRVETDEEGNVTATLPPIARLPHAWAGWPEL